MFRRPGAPIYFSPSTAFLVNLSRQIQRGLHGFAVLFAPGFTFEVTVDQLEIELQQRLVCLNFEGDLVTLDFALRDWPLPFLARPRASGELIAILFEIHEGVILLSFAVGTSDVETARPLAGHVCDQKREAKKQQATQ